MSFCLAFPHCPIVPRRGAGLQAAAERGSGPGLVPEPASQVAQEGTAPQDRRTLLWHLVYVPRRRPRPRTPGSQFSHSFLAVYSSTGGFLAPPSSLPSLAPLPGAFEATEVSLGPAAWYSPYDTQAYPQVRLLAARLFIEQPRLHRSVNYTFSNA